MKSGRNGHFEKAKAGQNCQKWPILRRNFKVPKPNENRTVVRRKKTTRKKSPSIRKVTKFFKLAQGNFTKTVEIYLCIFEKRQDSEKEQKCLFYKGFSKEK